jgi:hypothetical protein
MNCTALLLTLLTSEPTAEAPAVEDLIRSMSAEEMTRLGRDAVAALSSYRYRLTKQERVGNHLLDAQQIDTYVREKPFAVRMEYLTGPASGRLVVFNTRARPRELRVREAGFASIFGPLWFSIDASEVKADTNHRVTELGVGRLLERLSSELERAKAQGSITIKHEGWNAERHWCVRYTASSGRSGLIRVCSDVRTRLLTDLELFDKNDALLERHSISAFDATPVADALFDPERM